MEASFENLVKIVETRKCALFTWPDDEEEFEPLLIDITTANGLLKVHKALNEKNQSTFEKWISQGRGHFGAMVELMWKTTGFKVTG